MVQDRFEDARGGQSRESPPAGGSAGGESRGERFDEAQGGGRGADEVSPSAEEAAFAQDQRDHQDRGQEEAEFEAEPE